MSVVNHNFVDEVIDFVEGNKTLCILTLGMAVVVYSTGNLVGRAVSWIKECHSGADKKTSEVAEEYFMLAEEDEAKPSSKLSEKSCHWVQQSRYICNFNLQSAKEF
jgi:hypothetical protein